MREQRGIRGNAVYDAKTSFYDIKEVIFFVYADIIKKENRDKLMTAGVWWNAFHSGL